MEGGCQPPSAFLYQVTGGEYLGRPGHREAMCFVGRHRPAGLRPAWVASPTSGRCESRTVAEGSKSLARRVRLEKDQPARRAFVCPAPAQQR